MAEVIDIQPGMNVELVKEEATEETQEIVMTSRVMSIGVGRKLSISMPMHRGFTVSLHEGETREIRFLTGTKSWWCKCVVLGRHEDGNFVIADIELITRLQLFTRRRYFRVSTTIPISMFVLSTEKADELREYHNDGVDLKQAGFLVGINEAGFEEAVVVDLSGGGMQIITKKQLQEKDILYVKLLGEYGTIDPFLYCKVVMSEPVEKHPGTFVCRVRFIWISDFQREAIVKYVFLLDRKQLKAQKQG